MGYEVGVLQSCIELSLLVQARHWHWALVFGDKASGMRAVPESIDRAYSQCLVLLGE